MQNRTLLILTILVLIAMGGIFAINFLSMLPTTQTTVYLSPNDVRGMAVVHENLPYTLNFDQQNQVVEFINLSTPLNNKEITTHPIPFEKLIIYRFKQPDIEITPAIDSTNALIFKVPSWNSMGDLQDTSKGKFLQLLQSTYAH